MEYDFSLTKKIVAALTCCEGVGIIRAVGSDLLRGSQW
jgi:hypothetical protein